MKLSKVDGWLAISSFDNEIKSYPDKTVVYQKYEEKCPPLYGYSFKR